MEFYVFFSGENSHFLPGKLGFGARWFCGTGWLGPPLTLSLTVSNLGFSTLAFNLGWKVLSIFIIFPIGNQSWWNDLKTLNPIWVRERWKRE